MEGFSRDILAVTENLNHKKYCNTKKCVCVVERLCVGGEWGAGKDKVIFTAYII